LLDTQIFPRLRRSEIAATEAVTETVTEPVT